MAETTCDTIARVYLRPLDSLSDAERCRVLARRCRARAKDAERDGRRASADRLWRLGQWWDEQAAFWTRGGAA